MVANAASDSIISTTNNSIANSPYTSATPTLCPKCHGEGKISKALSKKARIRQQRRIYHHQQQEKQNEEENIQLDNHKRIKRSTQTPILSETTPLGSSEGDKKNNEKGKFKEPKLQSVPRRWDPCLKCDQTGLLIPLKHSSSERSSSAVTLTHDRPLVAIIGGGIGGIALAVALRHRGIPFVVYEKDSRFDQRRQGYGLTLQQARRALQALGIFENSDGDSNRSSKSGRILQEHAVTSTKHVVHTPDGNQVGEWGLRRWVGDSKGAKNIGNTNFTGSLSRDKAVDNTKMAEIKYSTDTANATTSGRIKPHAARARNKKRRQNLHVPRQTLRYALLEALKEASGVGTEEAAAVSNLSVDDARDSDSTRTTNAKSSRDDDHDNLDIAWGHKLVSIQPSKSLSGKNGVQLAFEVANDNGNDKRIVNAQADLVVGCDGIRSSTRKQFLRENIDEDTKDIKPLDASTMPLRYLNCVVILGICPLRDLIPKGAATENEDSSQQQKSKQMELSPLLDGETVFQTADGTTRIYLMPYSKKKDEYMWQLSFPVPDEEIAIDLSRRGSKALKEEALRRCQSWHVPIPDILKATPIELVSGYPVYDREILTLDTLSASRNNTSITNNEASDAVSGSLPITLLGDAAHPMSPFKGQGANQALLDALSLARNLYRIHCREGRSLEKALEFYETEMLDRSSEKVRASSAAARFLHTDIAIQEGDVTRGAAFSSSTSATNESRARHESNGHE